MSRYIANVDIYVESMDSWILKTNALLDALSNEIITANVTYANTGNTSVPRWGQLYGGFGANSVVVTNQLSGGTIGGLGVVSQANLNITSNVYATGQTWQLYSNLNVNATSVIIQANNQSFNSNSSITAIQILGNGTVTNTNIGGTTLNVSANIVATGTNHTVAGNVNFDTNTLFVDSIHNRVGVGTSTPDANLTINGTSNTIGAAYYGNTLAVVGATTLSNTLNVAGLSTLAGNMNTPTGNASIAFNVGSNVSLTTTALTVGNSSVNTTSFAILTNYLANSNGVYTTGVVNAATHSSGPSFTANSTLVNALAINVVNQVNTASLFASANVSVGANVTITPTSYYVGNSTSNVTISVPVSTFNSNVVVNNTATVNNLVTNSLTFLSNYNVNVVYSANIGTNISTPTTIYSYPKASYTSGKFTVQVVNGTNTQISDMILTQNGTEADITVFGTVATPATSISTAPPLGGFSAAINSITQNVELYLSQTYANSAVTVIANLIK